MTCPDCSTEIPAGFKFCGQCGRKLGAPEQPAPQATAHPQLRPKESVRDERRDVTVLFADVSGFTSMCEQLDPEDVHAVMNECFEGLSHAIHEEDGYIDKYIGDNVMALFGAPVAHEDDPARACRAALVMQEFLRNFAQKCEKKTGIALRMRIGIHAGLVVAGGVGSDARKDYSVMGDTVNLSARLESAAPPGGIFVSGAVANRTAGLFEFGPRTFLAVKGKEQPVEAATLLKAVIDAEIQRDFSVPLIGRTRELDFLSTCWNGARLRTMTQWIETHGEIGLGKTRLVREAGLRLKERVLAVVSTAEACRRPFGLVRRLISGVIRAVSGHASPPETREAFSGAVAVLGEEVHPFIDALWYLAAPSRLAVPAPDPDPESLRRTISHGVVTMVERLDARIPTAAIFLDSYESADEASRELLESLRSRSEGCPLPILVASRDSGPSPLDPEALLSLTPLSGDHAGELLNAMVPGAELPEAVSRSLLQRAAGVPLYLQELVQVLIDENVLTRNDRDGAWTYCPEVKSVNLPTSILAAMLSRLDRLDRPIRYFLCQCSVQGVEFAVDVADAVCRSHGHALPAPSWLQELDDRGFVSRLEGDGKWRFRQPLMQEACYETLLLRDRRQLHAATANALCSLAGGPHAVSPELLAYHYERAELWKEAANAYLAAGDRASEVFLNVEAIERYERAVELFAHHGAPSADDFRIVILAHRGAARVHLRLGAYEKADEHAGAMEALALSSEDLAEARRLAAAVRLHTGRTDEAERLLREVVSATRREPAGGDVAMLALYDLAELSHRAGRIEEALDQLKECRAVARSTDSLITVRADMLEGKILHTAGRFADATTLYARAYEAAERIGSLSERARARNNMGNAARDLGEYDAAIQYFERALELWGKMGDVECIAGAHINLGNIAMSQGNFAVAREHHGQSLAACSKIGNVQGAALAQANLAILAIEGEDGVSAVRFAEDALRTLGTSGNHVLRGQVLVVLGDGRLACGEAKQARQVFGNLLQEYDEANHPLIHAFAIRGLGRVAILEESYQEACTLLDQAIRRFELLKREQEAARTTLYRAETLWRSGELTRARAELERARERFVSMRAMRDIARVEQLLEKLRSFE